MLGKRTRSLCVGVVAVAAIVLAPGMATSREELSEPAAAVVAMRQADLSYQEVTAAEASAMTIDELAEIYDTPAKVWHLLDKTVIYGFDRNVWGADEYFATAEEFWARKKGDCEDYAALAKAILDRAGYTTVLFSAWRQERDAGGHAGPPVVGVRLHGRGSHTAHGG
jgi:predicted transglutaminase-like cysteine proteinase